MFIKLNVSTCKNCKPINTYITSKRNNKNNYCKWCGHVNCRYCN